MTVPIQRGSPRAPHARRFARELLKAMEKRDVGRLRLARALGLKSHSIIASWRSGSTLPRLDSAQLLAEVLEWPKLFEIVQEARTQVCARTSCDKTFVNEGGAPKQYCSDRCRGIQASVDGVGSGRRDRDTLFRERAQLQGAVRAFCQRCEPEGTCHDSGCPLRDVSPLPFLELIERRTTTATPYRREDHLEAIAAGAKAANERRWSNPEEHARQSERSREMWASRSEAEREAVGRRISAARRAAG